MGTNIDVIQFISIVGSLFIMIFIIELIRKKRLKEQYALLWLFFDLIFLVLSIWREGLDLISSLLGIAYPPATIFLLFLMAIFFIMIQYSVVITKLSERTKILAQEIGLLKLELKEKQNKHEEK